MYVLPFKVNGVDFFCIDVVLMFIARLIYLQTGGNRSRLQYAQWLY